ncbi:MAG: hypothetical protein JOZ32_20430, partial [Bryobacterales bacterium]|nr:hypothetical protein [Bryobacterales bacterium]
DAPYMGGYAGTGVYSAANAIAIDAQGNLYVTGYTTEVDFPSTLPIIGKGVPGGTLPELSQFAFVLKIAPGGKSLLFSRLIGGVQTTSCQIQLNQPNANTTIPALAIAADGTIVLGGNTNASDFLASLSGTSFDLCPFNSVAFLTRLSSDGSSVLSSSTFAGSSTSINFLKFDSSGDLYLAGSSSASSPGQLPLTPNALQGPPAPNSPGSLGFVAKLSSDTSSILYCTYLGGSPISGITFDAGGNLWIAGSIGASATAVDFPYPANVVRIGQDFVLQLNADGSAISAFYSLPNGAAAQQLGLDRAGNLLLLSSNGTVARFNPGTTANTPSILAIANAAKLSAGEGFSAGEIATIFGIGIGPANAASGAPNQSGIFPTELGGVQVLFNGQPAPLLYAGPSQINFQVPYEFMNLQAVQVVTPGGTTLSFNPPAINSLGIFQSSPGFAAALNQDLTVNSASNPARTGSIIALYVTGLSTLDNNVNQDQVFLADGQVASSASNNFGQQVAATTTQPATLNLPVLYAGPAPGLINGVSQVNLQLPLSDPFTGAWYGAPITLTIIGSNFGPTNSNTLQVYVK